MRRYRRGMDHRGAPTSDTAHDAATEPVAGARAVRDEDAFDVPAAAAWLRRHEPSLEGFPEVRQFAGGASNLTYLLRYPGRDLVLRRPPVGEKARGAHDMHREFTIQQRLAPVFGYVPPVVAHCADASVIGSEFYVMERVAGTILGPDLPPGWDLGPVEVRELCTGVLDRLIELHQVDAEQAGLADLGKGEGYVERQVGGWSDRFRRARTDDVGDFE
jgi:aminoglycoside phosphotransferase (APT) family kinase protein